MKVEDFSDWIREAKSDATYKSYTMGLRAFSNWYGKSANEILKERFGDLKSTDIHVRKRFTKKSTTITTKFLLLFPLLYPNLNLNQNMRVSAKSF